MIKKYLLPKGETKMVIVEFFSRTPIDNMISAFANRPERVVFLGEYKKMKRHDPVFHRFLESVGNTVTQLEYRNIRVRDLSGIVEALEGVIRDYPGCHFDITGGEPMAVAAMGVVCERYRGQGIELHQYNVRTGRVYDCDLNGRSVSSQMPDMTVEQNILLHGGSVVSSELRENGTYDWQMDREFLEDICTMWEICRMNCGRWNRQITLLDDMQRFNTEHGDDLLLSAPISALSDYLAERRVPMDLKSVFDKLEKAGLLKNVCREEHTFSLKFKNAQIRRCLTKAGTILELITYAAAREIETKDGAPCYTDAMTGVFIDWDAVVHDEEDPQVDTQNEIDVILMKGLIPVFVSCKNGAVEDDELYKLNTMAERFGGKYAAKVLLATTLGRGGRSKRYLLERAQDMGIKVIEGVHEMTREEFARQLRALG
ncbi:MAG: DUF1887 family protein [Oscillospiraceae bacterium]|nr:DUF1887 family protein [Oscillospiraceae bacterium]